MSISNGGGSSRNLNVPSQQKNQQTLDRLHQMERRGGINGGGQWGGGQWGGLHSLLESLISQLMQVLEQLGRGGPKPDSPEPDIRPVYGLPVPPEGEDTYPIDPDIRPVYGLPVPPEDGGGQPVYGAPLPEDENIQPVYGAPEPPIQAIYGAPLPPGYDTGIPVDPNAPPIEVIVADDAPPGNSTLGPWAVDPVSGIGVAGPSHASGTNAQSGIATLGPSERPPGTPDAPQGQGFAVDIPPPGSVPELKPGEVGPGGIMVADANEILSARPERDEDLNRP